MLKFFSFALLFFTFYFLLFTFPVNAQESSPLPTTVSPTSPLYTDLLIHNVFHTFSCLGVGQSIIGQPCLTYQLQKNAQGMMQGVPVLSSVDTSGGVLGTTTSLIGALIVNRPVRSVDYLASLGQDLGIVREANAQVVGSGAQILNPIETLWRTSRNISYVIMIIIFIIIGLMVMFRTKINPQTVITAQAALPGLVIGLIMISLSYFAAGFISDLAFAGTNLVGYYFSIAQLPDDPPQDLVSALRQRNVLNVFTPFTRLFTTGDITTALSYIWNDLADPNTNPINPLDLDPQRVLRYLTSFLAIQLLLPFAGIGGPITQVFVGVGSIIGTQVAPLEIAGWALAFIVIAILIYSMFRLLLRLINAYISIIFLTITAPFQFLFASLPGRQGIATGWVLNMLANVLAFPAVIAVLYFVAYIIGPRFVTICNRPNLQPPCPFIIAQNQIQDGNFVSSVSAQDPNPQNTIVGISAFPLFGGLNLDFVRILLAFGALTALPAIPDLIARSIGNLSQAGQILGQEIGVSTAAGQRYTTQFQQGMQGFAGNVGQWTDSPGYFGKPEMINGKPTGRILWEKTYNPLYGAKAGTGTRMVTAIRSMFGLTGKKP